MTRRRSKKNKSGSHGYGSSKKNRGAGNKGGRGNAGTGKKASSKRMTKDGVVKLGERGFKSRKPDQNAINLRDIDQRLDNYVEEGLAEEKDGKYVLDISDLGYEKVLGQGQINKEVEITAENFSSSAKSKIEEAGGETVEE